MQSRGQAKKENPTPQLDHDESHCPIYRNIIRHPVRLNNGKVYELRSLVIYLRSIRNGVFTCPLTRDEITSAHYAADLEKAIDTQFGEHSDREPKYDANVFLRELNSLIQPPIPREIPAAANALVPRQHMNHVRESFFINDPIQMLLELQMSLLPRIIINHPESVDSVGALNDGLRDLLRQRQGEIIRQLSSALFSHSHSRNSTSYSPNFFNRIEHRAHEESLAEQRPATLRISNVNFYHRAIIGSVAFLVFARVYGIDLSACSILIDNLLLLVGTFSLALERYHYWAMERRDQSPFMHASYAAADLITEMMRFGFEVGHTLLNTPNIAFSVVRIVSEYLNTHLNQNHAAPNIQVIEDYEPEPEQRPESPRRR